MATEELLGNIGTEIAALDLSASQYLCVNFSATGVNLAANGGAVGGILQNKPSLGDSCTVSVQGRSKAVAGGAIAKGALVASNAAGKLKVAATGNYILGQAMEAAGADGDIISVLMTRPGRVA